jgi:hypothetical protein
MVKDPKDLIGKWFSNVGGHPDEYWYIVDAQWHPQEVGQQENLLVYAIAMRRSRIRVDHFGMSHRAFTTPLTKQKTPELNYTIHKAIKYLFEKKRS